MAEDNLLESNRAIAVRIVSDPEKFSQMVDVIADSIAVAFRFTPEQALASAVATFRFMQENPEALDRIIQACSQAGIDMGDPGSCIKSFELGAQLKPEEIGLSRETARAILHGTY